MIAECDSALYLCLFTQARGDDKKLALGVRQTKNRVEKEPFETWRKGKSDLAPPGYKTFEEGDEELHSKFSEICTRWKRIYQYSGKMEWSKILPKLNEIIGEHDLAGKIVPSDGHWFTKGFLRKALREPLR